MVPRPKARGGGAAPASRPRRRAARARRARLRRGAPAAARHDRSAARDGRRGARRPPTSAPPSSPRASTTCRWPCRPPGTARTSRPTAASCFGRRGMATVLVDPGPAGRPRRAGRRLGRRAGRGGALRPGAAVGLLARRSASTGYTLGGGVGWLGARHGFAADSLLRAEVVTADGELVTRERRRARRPVLGAARRRRQLRRRHRDGVRACTRSPASTPAPPTSPSSARAETLARYRDWIADAPDELSTAVLLTRLPGGRAGARDQGACTRARPTRRGACSRRCSRRPARRWSTACGPCASPTRRWAAPRPGTSTVARPARRGDRGARRGAAAPTVEVRHWGGAMARPAAGAGPVGHRDVPLSVIVDARVPDLAAALAPHATGGSFLNFLADPARTATAYTPADYAALREVKAAYDPDDVFRVGHDIAAADATSAVDALGVVAQHPRRGELRPERAQRRAHAREPGRAAGRRSSRS